MTNERYLIISYFAAAGGGLCLAVLTAALLSGPARRAVECLLAPVARTLRRLLPTWLILLVLFAFMSVSYLDCQHHDYQQVVQDRPHLEDVTHKQAENMLTYLCVGLLAYALALGLALVFCPGQRKTQRG